MSLTNSSLRQYPAVQLTRKSDLRQNAALESRFGGRVKRSIESSFVHVRDFQDQQRDQKKVSKQSDADSFTPSNTNMSPATPDLRHPSMHVPMRKSSRARSSPRSPGRGSSTSSNSRYETFSQKTDETSATSIMLGPLQTEGPEGSTQFNPVDGDDPSCFDLIATSGETKQVFSLENRTQQLFSREHLKVIFSDPSLLLKFTAFLSSHRPQSVPILVYYLDALKALKAIAYANAIAEALDPVQGLDFTSLQATLTMNVELEEKAAQAFNVLVTEDLPTYITHIYTQVVGLSVSGRITGTLPLDLRERSEGLAEVFCLTDPSKPDNPIVFASEEFHRTTQYGMSYAIGRNCRFLQGPKTNPTSIRRLGDSVRNGSEHCEVFLNYRRDGSPFVNLLMIAPLRDSRGKTRYFIGAQVDVSGLVKECTDLESLQRLVDEQEAEGSLRLKQSQKDEFQELSEMFNMCELSTVKEWGGRMHQEKPRVEETGSMNGSHKTRLLLNDPSPDISKSYELDSRGGRLSGVYQNYLLVRPHPSLRILFASPSLRVPGLLQSPLMDKIGGSSRVREELTAALAEGRGVTAKVRWVSKADEDGRNRWIHCTPLMGSNSQIGVWMLVLVDDEKDTGRKWKQAPPIPPLVGGAYASYDSQDRISGENSPTSVRGREPGVIQQQMFKAATTSIDGASTRSTSPSSLRF